MKVSKLSEEDVQELKASEENENFFQRLARFLHLLE